MFTIDGASIVTESSKKAKAISLYNQAMTLHYTDQVETALKMFHQVAQLQSADVETLLNLGITLSQLGNPNEALDMYHQAHQLQIQNTKSKCPQGFGKEY